jgi:hypothetical protein
MKIQLDNLDELGLILDRPPSEIDPRAFSSGLNIRFLNGRVISTLPDSEVLAGATDTPLFLIPWISGASLYWIYATPTKIWSVLGTHSDISGGVYHATADLRWVGTIFSGIPILTNASLVDKPQRFNPTTGLMQNLDNFPATDYVKVVRQYGDFLIGLNLKRGTDLFPHTLKWSDAAALGTLPGSWDATDPTTFAGERDLGSDYGDIVDCLELGRMNVVYKEDAAFAMILVGGQSVFSTPPLPFQRGLIAPDCVCQVPMGHFVVGQGRVYVHDGNTFEDIIEGRALKWFFNSINASYISRTWVTQHPILPEVWVGYVSNASTNGYHDRVGIWNWKNGTWTIRDIDSITFATQGYVSGTEAVINDYTQVINSYTQVFDARTYNLAKKIIVGCSPVSTMPLQKLDEVTTIGTAKSFFLERLDLPISGQAQDGTLEVDTSTTKFLRRIYFKLKGAGTVTIKFGQRSSVDAPIDWSPPESFEIGVDRYIDCWLQYTLLSYRIESTGMADFEYLGASMEIEPLGVNTL